MSEIKYRCKWWLNKRCTQEACGNRDPKYEAWKVNNHRNCLEINEVYLWIPCIEDKEQFIKVIDD